MFKHGHAKVENRSFPGLFSEPPECPVAFWTFLLKYCFINSVCLKSMVSSYPCSASVLTIRAAGQHCHPCSHLQSLSILLLHTHSARSQVPTVPWPPLPLCGPHQLSPSLATSSFLLPPHHPWLKSLSKIPTVYVIIPEPLNLDSTPNGPPPFPSSMSTQLTVFQ